MQLWRFDAGGPSHIAAERRRRIFGGRFQVRRLCDLHEHSFYDWQPRAMAAGVAPMTTCECGLIFFFPPTTSAICWRGPFDAPPAKSEDHSPVEISIHLPSTAQVAARCVLMGACCWEPETTCDCR